MGLLHRRGDLVGQRLLVGVGGGRKRLNVLGAYCPDDGECQGIRLSRDNVNSQRFVVRLEPLPAYSPNLNLIERLWKFLRKEAFTRRRLTFEAMEQAVSAVLGHLGDYRDELATLMTEKFQRHPWAESQAA